MLKLKKTIVTYSRLLLSFLIAQSVLFLALHDFLRDNVYYFWFFLKMAHVAAFTLFTFDGIKLFLKTYNPEYVRYGNDRSFYVAIKYVAFLYSMIVMGFLCFQ
mgnify:CR=1 FL=1